MLVVDQGRGVSHEQVNSIRYMVSSAVTGMSAQDVTITDSKGNLLVRQVAEDEAGGGDSNRQLEIADKMEKQFKEKAEAILRPVIGLDKVVAMVSCDIDFDNIDRIVEQYDQEKATVISEKTTTEDLAKMGGGPGGKVGSAGNMANEISVKNPTGAGGEEKVASEQKKTAERKYVVPKTVEKKTIKGGKVRKLTVAVSICKKPDGTAWAEDEIKNFKALVSAAVGVENYFTPEELKKNPPVIIQQMDFVKPEVQKFEVPVTDSLTMSAEKVMNSPLVRPVFGIILLGVLYMVFRSYFNKTNVE
jgi:flagellar M-ring protein FliF